MIATFTSARRRDGIAVHTHAVPAVRELPSRFVDAARTLVWRRPRRPGG